jgi:hypothetical protein
LYLSIAVGAVGIILAPLAAQQPPAGPGAPGGGRGGFGRGAAAYDYADNTGFTSLFDGKTLNGWDSDTRFWSVKDSSIYVQATCERPTGTIYAVWQGGDVSDFILKYELKGTAGINSGMQFRSYMTADPSVNPKYPPRPARGGGAGRGPGGAANTGAGRGPAGAPPAAGAAGAAPGGPARAGRGPACANPGTPPSREEEAKWDMFGPQADYDGNNNFSAMFYEQGGRGIIALPGHVIYSEPGSPVRDLTTLADKATLDSWFKKEDWNQFVIVAKGSTTSLFMNGHLVTEFIDTDPTYFRPGGKIGLEVEATGELWARNIWLKKL